MDEETPEEIIAAHNAARKEIADALLPLIEGRDDTEDAFFVITAIFDIAMSQMLAMHGNNPIGVLEAVHAWLRERTGVHHINFTRVGGDPEELPEAVKALIKGWVERDFKEPH